MRGRLQPRVSDLGIYYFYIKVDSDNETSIYRERLTVILEQRPQLSKKKTCMLSYDAIQEDVSMVFSS